MDLLVVVGPLPAIAMLLQLRVLLMLLLLQARE